MSENETTRNVVRRESVHQNPTFDPTTNNNMNESEAVNEESDERRAQQRQSCNCGTCERCKKKEKEEELVFKYGAKHVIMIFVPVTACMLFVIVSLKIITSYQSSGGVYLVYTPLDEDTTEGGNRFWNSLGNAAIVIGVVIFMTIVLLLLYKYRLYKFLYGWLCFSSFMLLFFITYSYVSELTMRFNIIIDYPTLILLMWNFGCIGMICIHWIGPLRLQQIYLIVISSQMSLVFIKYLPEWTTWILLAFISVWDLIAVLCPFGPLNLLVKTAMERNEKLLPALVYSSTVMYPLITMASENSETELVNSDGDSSARRQSYGTTTSSRRINQTPEEIETFVLDSNVNRTNTTENSNTTQQTNEPPKTEEDEDGVKLGLGDFIFYSILVGKASILSDWNTVIACFVAILIGLSLTLLLLAIYRKPLPALPISLTFGLIFYFCTNRVVRPFYEELSARQFFV